MKITSTEDMNEAFREKDDKYREWATKDKQEKKVAKVVMVPLIISHDGAVHKDSVRRWKDFAPDIQVDWVRMAQNEIRYNVVIVGRFFNMGSWVSETWRKVHPEELTEEPDGPQEIMTNGIERRTHLQWNQEPEGAVCVCGLRARHLHMAFG